MFALILALQLFAQAGVPGPAASEWMDPQRFGLCIGMSRADIEAAIERAGLEAKPGKYSRQLVVNYSETRTLMLQFVDDKLQSVRFELVDFIPAVRLAYGERIAAIEKGLGYEAVKTKGDLSVALYNKESPNVMVVLSTLPNDDFGKQGLGYLAIRWFDPSAEKIVN